jgi:hypothetical protein
MSLFVLFFAACVMFYTTAVSVKMLPLDNKSEFQVVVNFPEGTSLITTANLMSALAIEARQFDEVVSLQTYVGTASPYNFNGLVRHYYLRTHPWQADMQVVLTHKNSREITSHEIAVAMREVMTPIATAEGARIQIVEMPPGPPVLQSVVAEIYGPDAETRRQFARDMTEMFEQAESITDVDNLMQQPFEIWRFEVDRDKALRKGITIDSINTTLKMAMGGFVVGDLKRGSVVEPTFIILQVPLSVRSEFSRLGTIPVQAPDGSMLPLSELGQFVKDVEQDIIFHKNLREVEFVTGENAGELAAPIYGMFQVDDMLADYIAPDGVIVDHGFFSGGFFGPPENSSKTGFEWTGEWTVTYETFRDMGGAFILAMIIIYMLVVIEFKNFIFPAIIMAPIPLTLVGIIPGHWFFGAEFTATSMIGWIALAGIIVRNSILLVDFTKHEVRRGVPVIDAVINSCQARTRPIVITALALVGGSSVILTDPIFEGMAISLLFGVVVSTALTLFVIPLGCISAKKAFLCEDGREDGIARADDSTGADSVVVEEEDKAPIWMRLYSAIIGLVGWIIAIFAMVFNLLRMLVGMLLPKSEPPASEPPPPASTPPTAPAPAPVEKAVATSEKTEVKKVVITEKSTISEDVPAKKAVKNVSVKAAVAKTVVTEKSAIATPVEKPATTKKVVTKKAVTKKTAAKKATAKTVATTAAAAKAATVNKAVVKKVARKKVVKKKTVTKAVPVKKVVAKKIPSKKISSGARRGIRLKNDDS